MNIKVSIPLFAVIIVAIMGIYFIFNPSYQKSIQAKYYFEIGEYDEAYSLAKEAFELNLYNRMASTIMTQSQTSLKYKAYIDMGKKYMIDIDKIAHKEVIQKSDKAKIRLICGVMIDSYVKLAPSVVTDKGLVKKAAEYHSGFEKLLEKVNR